MNKILLSIIILICFSVDSTAQSSCEVYKVVLDSLKIKGRDMRIGLNKFDMAYSGNPTRNFQESFHKKLSRKDFQNLLSQKFDTSFSPIICLNEYTLVAEDDIYDSLKKLKLRSKDAMPWGFSFSFPKFYKNYCIVEVRSGYRRYEGFACLCILIYSEGRWRPLIFSC